jgi:hypothetical protein
MWCHVDPDKFSALQSNDDEDIEQIEANGRGNEQIHGGNVERMVTQEGSPTKGGRSASLDHILRDAVTPVIYIYFDQLQSWMFRGRKKQTAASAPAEPQPAE